MKNFLNKIGILYFLSISMTFYIYANNTKEKSKQNTYVLECSMSLAVCRSDNMNELRTSIPRMFSELDKWFKYLGFPLPPLERDGESKKIIRIFDIHHSDIVGSDIDCSDLDFNPYEQSTNPNDDNVFNLYRTAGCASSMSTSRRISLN